MFQIIDQQIHGIRDTEAVRSYREVVASRRHQAGHFTCTSWQSPVNLFSVNLEAAVSETRSLTYTTSHD